MNNFYSKIYIWYQLDIIKILLCEEWFDLISKILLFCSSKKGFWNTEETFAFSEEIFGLAEEIFGLAEEISPESESIYFPYNYYDIFSRKRLMNDKPTYTQILFITFKLYTFRGKQ
jgi:hypothetical protein